MYSMLTILLDFAMVFINAFFLQSTWNLTLPHLFDTPYTGPIIFIQALGIVCFYSIFKSCDATIMEPSEFKDVVRIFNESDEDTLGRSLGSKGILLLGKSIFVIFVFVIAHLLWI